MTSSKKTSPSLFTIVLSFWLFFPLGFVLIYLRLKNKNGKYYAITKELFWTGIVWGCFGLFYLVTSLTDSSFFSDYLPSGLFIFVIPGTICFYFGNKRNEKMKIYDKYISYISTRRKIKIDGLCNNLDVSYDVAVKTLEEMILKGFINGYLEEDELIIKRDNTTSLEITEQDNKIKQTKVIKCTECGAKNTVIIGEAKECDYCGSKLM